MCSIQKQFQTELEESCEICRTQYKYNPTAFKIMMAKSDAVKAAKQLLKSNQWQDGFTKLWEIGKLSLTVEAHVVKPEYQPLFCKDEVAIARERLEKCGYEFPNK